MNSKILIEKAVIEDIEEHAELYQVERVTQINAGDARFLHQNFYASDHKERMHTRLFAIEANPNNTKAWLDGIEFLGSDIENSAIGSEKIDLIYADLTESLDTQDLLSLVNHAYTIVAYVSVTKNVADMIEKQLECKQSALAKALDYEGVALTTIAQTNDDLVLLRILSKKYETEDPVRRGPFLGDKPSRQWREGGYDFSTFPWGRSFAGQPASEFKSLSELKNSHSIYKAGLKDRKQSIMQEFQSVQDMHLAYNKDKNHILDSFKSLDSLGVEALDELQLTKDAIEKALRNRLTRLNSLFWHRLIELYFDKEANVSERLKQLLVSKSLGSAVSNTLNGDEFSGSMPFSATNAQVAIVKMSDTLNTLASSDFTNILKSAANPKNMIAYQSNSVDLEAEDLQPYDKWGLVRDVESFGAVMLKDTLKGKGLFNIPEPEGLIDYNHEATVKSFYVEKIIDDISPLVAASGMAKVNKQDALSSQVLLRKRVDVFTVSDNKKPVFSFTLYKGGDHKLELSKELALRINIIIGKSKGWLTDGEQAYQEMAITDMSLDDFKEFYESVNIRKKDIYKSDFANFLGLQV